MRVHVQRPYLHRDLCSDASSCASCREAPRLIQHPARGRHVSSTGLENNRANVCVCVCVCVCVLMCTWVVAMHMPRAEAPAIWQKGSAAALQLFLTRSCELNLKARAYRTCGGVWGKRPNELEGCRRCLRSRTSR